MDFSVLDLFLRLDQVLGAVATSTGPWLYVILFAVIFCETGLVVMPFLPGDSLLFMAGALTAVEGSVLNVHGLAALLIAAAILGDALNYSIGRHVGLRLFSNPDSRIFRREHLQLTQAFYAKHGGKTIVIARLVPIVRTFAPFVAGMSQMAYGRFALYNVVGAVVWVVSLLYAGHFFGNLPWVKANLSGLVLAIIVLSILPTVLEIWRNHRASRRSAQA
jgi:membrane-associated protein